MEVLLKGGRETTLPTGAIVRGWLLADRSIAVRFVNSTGKVHDIRLTQEAISALSRLALTLDTLNIANEYPVIIEEIELIPVSAERVETVLADNTWPHTGLLPPVGCACANHSIKGGSHGR